MAAGRYAWVCLASFALAFGELSCGGATQVTGSNTGASGSAAGMTAPHEAGSGMPARTAAGGGAPVSDAGHAAAPDEGGAGGARPPRTAGVSGGRAGESGGGAGGASAGSSAGGSSAAAMGGSSAPTRIPQVPAAPKPTVETDSFKPSGSITDVADDSAIYANPTDPAASVVIAGNKDDVTGGIGVFDMQGKLLQFRQEGKIGNVDLRSGFPWGGKQVVLVAANNRTSDTLSFWQFDPATRQLSEPAGSGTRTVSPNYGLCLYHSAMTGKFYVFVTQETGASTMEQYELGENAGKVTATKVRSFDLGSITEGCVADDELGRLYVAQEDVGLWRYGAEPSAGTERAKIAAVGDGHVVADLEGVALAKGAGTTGYLVVSIQSESRFVTYDRETNAFLQSFRVGAGGAIDTVTQTDGLDISTASLGPGFSSGALVVHDGSNTGGESSNLKYIPLE